MRLALAAALLLFGCATAKDRERAIDQYVQQHPTITRDEIDRMKHREARVGDPVAQVQLAWQGAEFELVQTGDTPGKDQPAVGIWMVRFPIGTPPVYLEGPRGQPQTQLTEEGSVTLTFENGKLTRWQVLSEGNLKMR
jgi:hypothetical protein